MAEDETESWKQFAEAIRALSKARYDTCRECGCKVPEYSGAEVLDRWRSLCPDCYALWKKRMGGWYYTRR
jgi:hypothetical protein